MLFNCFRCRHRRLCLNSLLLWSTNFATVVTRSNISLLYYLKVKICFVQGYNDIGVIMATNWCHYLFYWQFISRHRELLFQNRSRELFPPIAAPMIVKFKRNLYERYRDILDQVFMVRKTVKTGQSWCWAVTCRNRSAFEMLFHLILV